MSHRPVILAIVPVDDLRSPAVRRAQELARRLDGVLHLCRVVDDPECAGRFLLDDHQESLLALARECSDSIEEVRHEVIWTGVPHQAILDRCRALHADYVVKDIGRTSALRRLLFTPLDWQLVRELPANLLLVRPESPPVMRRVLAAVDALAPAGERADLNRQVIETAAALAASIGAELELASVAVTPGPTAGHCAAPPPAELRNRHHQALAALGVRYGMPAEHIHGLEGSATASIRELVASRCFSLVVVGNVHRNAMLRMLIGSTAEALLREVECDLMVVGGAGPAELPSYDPAHQPAADSLRATCI